MVFVVFMPGFVFCFPAYSHCPVKLIFKTYFKEIKEDLKEVMAIKKTILVEPLTCQFVESSHQVTKIWK